MFLTTRKICGKNDRGRQRQKILDNLYLCHGIMSERKMRYAAGDLKMWRVMITQDTAIDGTDVGAEFINGRCGYVHL